MTRRILTSLVVLGIVLRTVAYFGSGALWLDEVLLSRNIIELPLRELLFTHSWPSMQYGEIALDLYDLSDPARLAAANAATFPVSPMPTDPAPGCRPWNRPEAFSLR